MKKKKLAIVFGNTFEYYEKVKKIFGSDLVVYYPLSDLTGTSDGTHPNAAGHAKIAAAVLALLP